MNPNARPPEISHALFISVLERRNLGNKALSRLHRYICEVTQSNNPLEIRRNLNAIRVSYSNLYRDRYPKASRLSLEGEAYALTLLLAEHSTRTAEFKELGKPLTSFAKDIAQEAQEKYDLGGATLVFIPIGIDHDEEIDRIVALAREVVNDTDLVSLWGGQRDVIEQEKITAGLNLIFPLS